MKIRCRTWHQIRMQADRLLAPKVSDVDGNTEERRGTVSVFNGTSPTVQVVGTAQEEGEIVSDWLRSLAGLGVQPHETGIFVRSNAQLDRGRAACSYAGLQFQVLDERRDHPGRVSISTMHLAKGLGVSRGGRDGLRR